MSLTSIERVEVSKFSSLVDRWALQDMARRVLSDDSLFYSCIHKHPRVVHCMRTLTGGFTWDEAVQVERVGLSDSRHFRYSGVQTCGSWSSCPICAAKIANQRRREITEAVDGWRSGSVVMLTLTAPHFHGESLDEVRSRFMAARRLFRHQKSLKRDPAFVPFTSLRVKYSIKGSVSALELTYSDANGWHFHSHELLFCGQTLNQRDMQDLETKSKLAWFRACSMSKITISDRFAFFLHSCKVTPTDSKSSQYLSKFGSWTAADELSRSQIKRGRHGNLTPWDFLRLAGDSDEKYKKYGSLFREVFDVFFGKQQIFFEKGFKAILGIGSLSDQQIADSDFAVGEYELFGVLSYFSWRRVCALKLRGEILARCAAGATWPEVMSFLRSKLCLRVGQKKVFKSC